MAEIDKYAEMTRQVNGTFKQKVNKKALEVHMRANWGKVTLKKIAEKFNVSEITIKRYAREFKLVRTRESDVIRLSNSQRLTTNGILTVKGAVTRHELR
jgi:hypothetical protein